MTDLETLRAALAECVDELQYVQRQHGKNAGLECLNRGGIIDRACAALRDDPGGRKSISTELGMFCLVPRECAFCVNGAAERYEFTAPGRGTLSLDMWDTEADTQAAVDAWWSATSAMMAPDAPETDRERDRRIQAHIAGLPDPLAASPAGQTIPGGVVDAMKRARLKAVDFQFTLADGTVANGTKFVSRDEDPTPSTDFGSQVTEALAHGRGIDPGGQGMRVPSPEEREAERARQAEYFRRNGVL